MNMIILFANFEGHVQPMSCDNNRKKIGCEEMCIMKYRK